MTSEARLENASIEIGLPRAQRHKPPQASEGIFRIDAAACISRHALPVRRELTVLG
jgi:hypothetical protein